MMILDTPIESLPATSPLTIKRLKLIGIETYCDLLNYFPYRYEDYSIISPIMSIQEGETVTIRGTVIKSTNEYTKRGYKLQKITLQDKTGSLQITWINQPYLAHIFKTGVTLSVSGLVTRFAGKLTLQPNGWEIIKDESMPTGRIIPVYSEIHGLSTKTLREKVFHVISHLKNTQEPPESLPTEVLIYNNLISFHEAYIEVHYPSSKERLKQARLRLGFNEMLILQLSLLLKKHEQKQKKVMYQFSLDDIEKKQKIKNFIERLPFKLTNGQKEAIYDIEQDLKKQNPMNRFLQGDVGSGKTVVAALAAYITYLNGYQTLIMAPTEILADQHYQTMLRLFKETSVKIAIQTGSKKNLKKDSSNFDIIVGTQALLTKSLIFNKVGFIVIDEQHRFGVAQRALLKEKGGEPHLLTMTATPIPRTLALTLYGEIDLTVISEMPQGRLPVKTYLVPSKKRQKAYEWIKNKILTDRCQTFIVCPLIEESKEETKISVKAAKKEYERLQKNVFPTLRVALLHGKLKSKEKTEIMQEFTRKKYDILVSTSVVEVGIDIPDATIMIIEGAEKYGLAQLHQLRGRIGRGNRQSYCYLFSDNQEPAVLHRLNFFSSTTNGAELSEYDLHHRGPGNIFGTNQHGYLKLKIASLSDISLIKQSKNAADYLIKKSPDLKLFPKLLSSLNSNQPQTHLGKSSTI